MRRVRGTINNDYVQPLKLGISDRLVVSPNNSYNSILLRNTHRPFDPNLYDLELWGKFDTNDFDGIHIHGALMRGSETRSLGSCAFDIHKVAIDSTWNETLLYQGAGSVLSDGSFGLSVTQSNLGSSNIMDGELTLAIYATAVRGTRTYKKKIYLNHLGTYDSIIRLRNKVKFLEIIKKDD